MSQVKKNKMAIARLKSDIETKYLYNGRTYGAAAIGLAANTLTTAVQGTGVEERIGDEIQLKYINFNLSAASAIGAIPFLRVMLLVNRTNNSSVTAPTKAELFDSAATDTEAVNSVLNKAYVGRDKKYTLVYDSGAIILYDASNRSRRIRVNKRLGYKVAYTGNTGTPSDMIRNNLILVVVSDSVGVSYNWSACVHFVDA